MLKHAIAYGAVLASVAVQTSSAMSAQATARAKKTPVEKTPRAGVAFYVAPGGDDAAAGGRDTPFATLAGARDAVRALKARKGIPAEGVTVWLRGGVYPVKETLSLGKEDSGAEGNPIVYAAMPGERPVLFGGTALMHAWFKPVTDKAVLDRIISPQARTNVLQCDLKAHGIADYGVLSGHGYCKYPKEPAPAMLYVGGKRMTLARWPNPDQHFPEMLWKGDNQRKGVVARSGVVDPGPKYQDPDFLERGGTFRYAFDRPELWTKAEDVWLDGVFAWSWEWSYNKVDRIDPVKKEITLRYGEHSGLTDQYSGNFFFAENLLEEIDQAGEYYLNRASGVLYFLPGPDFQPGTPVWLSALKSTMLELQNVSDVVIRGLTFDTGRANAVSVSNGTRVRIEQCEIMNCAWSGVNIGGRDCVLSSCHIHDVGASGAWAHGGDFKTLTPGNNRVEDCEIHDSAWYYRVLSPAIGFTGVGQRMTHNRIYNMPQGAILPQGSEHLIEYNDIHDVCREFIDWGAIHINTGHAPLERGWVIRRNYFHDIGATPDAPINLAAVYIDHSSQGGLVEENVFYRIGNSSRPWAFQAAQNQHGLFSIIRNNVFVDCTVPWTNWKFESPAEYVAFLYKDYKFAEYFAGLDLTHMPHLAKYPEARLFLPGAPTPTEAQLWLRFERNLIWNPNVPVFNEVVDGVWIQDKKARNPTFNPLVRKDNWVADADPGFVNAAADNFALRADAPAFEKIPGFTPIPFAEIGPRGAVGPQASAGGAAGE